MGKLVWLASFPKSGNTWLRIFLANLLCGNGAPVDINRLRIGILSAQRSLFEHWSGIEASALPPQEVARLRPRIFEQMAQDAPEPLFIKTHEAYTSGADGEPLFPAQVLHRVVYLVRNPLDVAVSYAHHAGIDYDQAIDAIADPNLGFPVASGSLPRRLSQRLSTWSQHVESWLRAPTPRLIMVRYEDLVRDPEPAFARIADFLELACDFGQIRRAVRNSSFDNLRKLEQATGFREKPATMNSFFRAGRVGQWRQELSPSQIQRLINTHRTVMTRLQYLDACSMPIL